MAGPSFWRRKSVRRSALQSGFVGGLMLAIVAAAWTAKTKLDAQGMTSGFDFLWKSTGWEMNFSLLPAGASDPYWWFLLMGLANTLVMGTLGLAGASVIGLVVGLMRSGTNPAARLIGTIYIETFRNLPLIVQLFFFYALANSLPNPRQSLTFGSAILNTRGIYLPGLEITQGSVAAAICVAALGLGVLAWMAFARRLRAWDHRGKAMLAVMALTGAGIAAAIILGHVPGDAWISHPEPKGLKVVGGIRLQPEFYTLAIAITLYGAAYVGEIVRGGFKSVGRGQMEAAKALGLTPWQIFSRVRMPLAFRAMLPILINQYVWLIKATTLGVAVGFSDFFMVIAGSINHSGQTLEFIGILMAGFLLINFSLAAILNRLNRAIALKGHNTGGAA